MCKIVKVLKAEGGGTDRPECSLWTLNFYLSMLHKHYLEKKPTKQQKKKISQNQRKSSKTKYLLPLVKLLSLIKLIFCFSSLLKGNKFRLRNSILPTLEMHLVRVHLSQLCVLLMNYWSQWVIGPRWETTYSWFPLGHWEVNCNSWKQPSSQFLSHLAVHTSNSYFSHLAARILCSIGTVAKALQKSRQMQSVVLPLSTGEEPQF